MSVGVCPPALGMPGSSAPGCVFSAPWACLCFGRLRVSFCAGILCLHQCLCPSGLSGSLSRPHHSVRPATLVTTVRMTWMSVPRSPASMGASALTLWPGTSAPVPLGRWVCQGQGGGQVGRRGLCPPLTPPLIFLPPGVLCEINEDDCGPGPPRDPGPRCLHNGTCVDLVGGFRCACPPGYTGLRCEADINECRPGACHAAHTRDCLQDPGGGFRCLCRPGFAGKGGPGADLGSGLCSPIVADPRLLLAQVPAARPSCLPASPSPASTEASAVLAQALGVH